MANHEKGTQHDMEKKPLTLVRVKVDAAARETRINADDRGILIADDRGILIAD